MILQPHPLPAFDDNYLWCLASQGQVLVVDPGDAGVVQRWLDETGLKLAVILVTHHHPDHIGGLPALLARHRPTVFGPDEGIPGIGHLLRGGETLALPGFGPARVLAVPGHTRAHIAYHLPEAGLLFCGDTLFSAGCGRLFEGTPDQLYRSLQSLATLPDTTQVCCAHEYTEANLRFADVVEPGNAARQERAAEVAALRRQGRPSLPVALGRERQYNPFLRCAVPEVVARASQEAGMALAPGLPVFTALRAWKDRFRG